MASVLCRLAGTRIKSRISKHTGRVKLAIAKGSQIMGVQRESRETCTKQVVKLDFQETFDEGPLQRLFKKLSDSKENIIGIG